MVLGGLRRCLHSTRRPSNPPPHPRLNKIPNYCADLTPERNGTARGGRKCNQNLLQQPSKSTQSTVCASEQMASLVAVKTMGRVSTHGLSQTHTHTLKHTHSHIPLVHFTHMVNKKFIILMGLQWGGGATQVTPSGWFVHHVASRCISAADTTSGLLRLLTSMLKKKKKQGLLKSL